eukprot:GHVU01030806.1.p1 GENE.GHVU01030806.1~~GHVU01030806.1.p1  ORF type:complete len:102 (+),score=4.19 GHVU01030806.1:172-477(+)
MHARTHGGTQAGALFLVRTQVRTGTLSQHHKNDAKTTATTTAITTSSRPSPTNVCTHLHPCAPAHTPSRLASTHDRTRGQGTVEMKQLSEAYALGCYARTV